MAEHSIRSTSWEPKSFPDGQVAVVVAIATAGQTVSFVTKALLLLAAPLLLLPAPVVLVVVGAPLELPPELELTVLGAPPLLPPVLPPLRSLPPVDDEPPLPPPREVEVLPQAPPAQPSPSPGALALCGQPAKQPATARSSQRKWARG
jgi:hypothetical protein